MVFGIWGLSMGTCWRAAGRSTGTAHRAHRRSRWSRQDTCCVGLLLLKMASSSVYVCVGFLLLLGVYLLYLPDPHSLEPSGSGVTLLVWTHPFGRYTKLPDCFKLYQIDGCTLTDDWGAYPHADAVLIHHRDFTVGYADLPPEPRPRAQKWIWMNYESPTHTPGLWLVEGVFNLTMSYRTDSDIFLPYGYLVHRGRTSQGLQQNRSAQPLNAPSRSPLRRPRLLAWVISNWSESQRRVAFYHELSQFIPVDVFGNGGRPIEKDPTGDGAAVRKLIKLYQFYLSLENSEHTDYITEKLWNAVRAGAVPVVLGPPRKNYEKFLPPEAFIHVDDFSTVRELAQYLLMLRRYPAQLRRHLDWRESYSVHGTSFWTEHYCTACRAVRRTRGRTHVVRDLAGWFYS